MKVLTGASRKPRVYTFRYWEGKGREDYREIGCCADSGCYVAPDPAMNTGRWTCGVGCNPWGVSNVQVSCKKSLK